MFNPHAAAPAAGGPPPKKYIKIDGVMKLNPDYKKWKEAQSGGGPGTTMANSDTALPIVTNMDDHEQLNAASVASGSPEIALAESTNATIEMYVYNFLHYYLFVVIIILAGICCCSFIPPLFFVPCCYNVLQRVPHGPWRALSTFCE